MDLHRPQSVPARVGGDRHLRPDRVRLSVSRGLPGGLSAQAVSRPRAGACRALVVLVLGGPRLGPQHGPRERVGDVQARLHALRGRRRRRPPRASARGRECCDRRARSRGTCTGARRRSGVRRTMSMHIVSEGEARKPLVSVIVPALNSSRTIGKCVAALAVQHTRRLYEVIVVHSGEDDTCAEATRELPEVRTIQLPERALAARARAVGVAAARGEILAFIDSDAYAAADWIDEVVRAAESGSDLICGSIGNANPDSAVARAEQLLMFSEFLRETPRRPMWFALSGNLVMRRSAYARLGPFVEIRAAEDLIFSRRVAMAGGRILFSPTMQVFHDN